jgi:sarcosine oxidase
VKPTPESEVIVIGGGVVGLAAAHALAIQRRNVRVLEQFEIGHTRGSSHGSTRAFRLSYRRPSWVRLAQEALARWRELEGEAGQELLRITGSIEVGRGLDAQMHSLAQCGAQFSLLERSDVQHRYGLWAPPDALILFQPQGGVLHAARIGAFLSAAAVDRGVQLLERTRAESINVGDRRVSIDTTQGRLVCKAVVVAAGPWAASLANSAGLELPVSPSRETVGYFKHEASFGPPILIDWTGPEMSSARTARRGRLVYALSSASGEIKVGLDHAGPATDPNDLGELDQETLDALRDWIESRLCLADSTPVRAETCLYTNARDGESFMVGRRGRIILGAACSGHGFKFAPVTGLRLAELVGEVLGA